MTTRRDHAGRFSTTAAAIDPWSRFVAKCSFDPGSGCVFWTGGTTSGRGNHAPYGSFKYMRRRWFAHRWAAKFIHGLEIEDMEVDHCCPDGPDTLCVQHLQAVTPEYNRELRWIRTQVGLIPPPWVHERDPAAVPFFLEPDWLTVPPDPCMLHAESWKADYAHLSELPHAGCGDNLILLPSVPGRALQSHVEARPRGDAAGLGVAPGAR